MKAPGRVLTVANLRPGRKVDNQVSVSRNISGVVTGPKAERCKRIAKAHGLLPIPLNNFSNEG